MIASPFLTKSLLSAPIVRRKSTDKPDYPVLTEKLPSHPIAGGSSYSWTMKTTESGDYIIRVVQGEELRNTNLDLQEFGLSGIHNDFPHLIPENEIWIAGRLPIDEYHFIISGVMARLKALKEGKDDSTAYDRGLKKEKAERAKSAGRFEDSGGGAIYNRDPRISLYLTIKEEGKLDEVRQNSSETVQPI